MLTRYLDAALRRARYEILKEDGSYYGEIPDCRGVYANAASLEDCRAALAATLEDWILLRIHQHLPLPRIDGMTLTVKK
ncbi:MAG: type II toxin-antitoxin system HicB family antitoxin [Phycisphaerae bacterium]